jgi:hypothetical protein
VHYDLDPQAVARSLLDDPRMIKACADHDLPVTLRLLQEHGTSLARIAEATGIGLRWILDYCTDTGPYAAGTIEQLSDGLRIPGRYFRIGDRPWENSNETASSNTGSSPSFATPQQPQRFIQRMITAIRHASRNPSSSDNVNDHL